ncbi:MAG: sugar transferase [Coriobacteriaceae bacterium]|nr:sugar transferase [Coriobacteriaceae bacterium]
MPNSQDVKLKQNRKSGGIYSRYIKRPLDAALAACALVLLCWLFAILAILVRAKLGSPVLFCQERPGRIDSRTGKERIFKLYKFRTMTNQRGKDGVLLSDEARLTRFGRLLRSTSLDELPEIFNILKGDMALIGPRPLLVKYLPLYSATQRRRHEERPGLTGLAQVNGRNAISWEQKFDYDVQYIDNITFMGDAMIFFKTIHKAFAKREGIGSSTCETMEEFQGTTDLQREDPPRRAF